MVLLVLRAQRAQHLAQVVVARALRLPRVLVVLLVQVPVHLLREVLLAQPQARAPAAVVGEVEPSR